jgi:hemerythrin
MAILWTEALAVGVEEIDRQHKGLFEQVDRLLVAAQKGAGQEELGNLLDFLGRYVVEHFGTEERFMAQYDYPESMTHKRQHADFVEYYKDVRARIDKEGASLSTLLQVQKYVVDWLNNHIRKSDKALGAYLKTKV